MNEKNRDLIICGMHFELRNAILNELTIMHKKDNVKIKEKIEDIKKQQQKRFKKRVYVYCICVYVILCVIGVAVLGFII